MKAIMNCCRALAVLLALPLGARGEVASAPVGWIHGIQPLRIAVLRNTAPKLSSVIVGGRHIPREGIVWMLENGVLDGVQADTVIVTVKESELKGAAGTEWKARVESLVTDALPAAKVIYSPTMAADKLPVAAFWPPKTDRSIYGFREVSRWKIPAAKDGVLDLSGSPMELGAKLRQIGTALSKREIESPEILVIRPTADWLVREKAAEANALDLFLVVKNLTSYAGGVRAKRTVIATIPVPKGADGGVSAVVTRANDALLRNPPMCEYYRIAAHDKVDEKIAELRAEGLGPLSTIGRDRLNVPWWKERFERHLDMIKTNDSYDVVFVGDSITHRWGAPGKDALRDVLGKYKVLNAGYVGDLTQHMIWRLKHGELDGYKAKLFMVMAGTNNQWIDPGEVAAGVQEVVKIISAKHPESKILLLAIFPRGETPKDGERVRVTSANAILEPWAKTMPNVVYADLKDHFLKPDGTISKDVFPDFLHPEHDAYYIWAKAVKPYFEQLIGF